MRYKLLIIYFLLLSSIVRANVQQVPQLLKVLHSTKEDTAKIEVYAKIIESYSITHIDSANYYLSIARQLASKINSQSSIAFLNLKESALLQIHGELIPARNITLQALEIYYALNNSLGLANTYHTLGVLDGRMGNYPIATSYLLRSLKFNEKIKNKQGIASNYLALGLVNMYIRNFKKSENYYINCLTISKEIGSSTYFDVCNNLGSLMGMKGDNKKALYYFELALASINENASASLKITLITNIAISYSNLNLLEKAKRFFDEALKLSVKYKTPELEARVLYNIGVTYEVTNPKLALQYFDEALSIANRLNNKIFCVDIYESIYAVKTSIKDYKGAVKALEMYHLYSDSVLSTQNKSEIELLQSEFELEKSKAEVKQLELNTQKQNLQIIVAVLIFIAVLLILAVVSFASNRRKKLNIDLRQSVVFRDKLLSVISHDLRAPINSVLVLLDELGRPDLQPKEKANLLDDLKKQTQLSMVTLDNILKWGQLQIRGINTNPQEFLFLDIVYRNLELFEIKAKIKNVKFNLNFDSDIKLLTDSDQLDFVIRNLCSNAIKYSDYNSTVHIHAKQHNVGQILITVEDEGIGMDSETLKSLFGVNPILNQGTSNEKGSGLGLLLCKDFIEANGGSIWIESIYEKGTKVSFICNSTK